MFTADSRISVNVVEGTQTFYNNDFTLDGKAVKFNGAGNAQNGYCFAHYNFSSLCDKAAKVKVEFDCVLGNGARSRISIGDGSVRGNTGNSSKTTYSNKGAIFMLGTEKNVGYINGTNNAALLTALTQKWLKVTIEVDETEKTYTYSIVNKETDEELYNNGENPIAFWSSDATNCTQIDMFGYINSSHLGLIDNLVITVTADEREQADYTVNFLDSEGNAIAEPATRSGAVGDGITLLPADKEAKWNGEKTQKYIYDSDDADSQTIASGGSTVVNITYRNAETYNYTVVSNADATLNSGSGFEGESIRAGYPRYQIDGTALYMAGVDNKEYRTTVNLTEDNVSKTVNYELQDGKEVAYYIEGEDITGMTLATNDNIPVRASNAKAAKSNEDVEITTLPAGKYKLHVGIFTSKSSYGDNTVNFGIGAEVFNAAFANVNLCEVESEEYTINATTSIKYLGSTSWGGAEFDYIWIEKTGDAEEISSVEATVGEAGWATYIAPYALDFSGVAGLTAYTATVSENTVTLTEVDNVPAGTGVVLKGATNTYNIPIIDSSETAKGDLKGSISKDTTADGTQYILTKDGVNAQFAPATASTTIAAGKAYLVVAGGESRLNVVIVGETTGIKAIEAQEAQEGIYNLQGQRVAKAQKGLYIVNGKKAIVK